MKDRFHTVVDIPVPEHKISYQSPCIMMGSCFSDEIGSQMAACKFPVLMNPFGTLFNPASIGSGLQRMLSGAYFQKSDLHFYNDLWFSFYHYTAFADPDPEKCLVHINTAFKEAVEKIKTCDFLILTFGTAWIFTHKETQQVVANCHKLPSARFIHSLMDPEQIIKIYEDIFLQLKSVNPNMRVILTLSPVRHWANGAVNNQLSKSILHFSMQKLCVNHAFVSYFPAYEIFMDELRDYRFYADDMLHPSSEGIRYVWERFCDTWMDAQTKKTMTEITAVLKALHHRPIHTDTPAWHKFVRHTLSSLELLSQRYPYIDLRNDIAQWQHEFGKKETGDSLI